MAASELFSLEREHADRVCARLVDCSGSWFLGADEARLKGQPTLLGWGQTFVAYRVVFVFPWGQESVFVVRVSRVPAGQCPFPLGEEVAALKVLAGLDLPAGSVPEFVAAGSFSVGKFFPQELDISLAFELPDESLSAAESGILGAAVGADGPGLYSWIVTGFVPGCVLEVGQVNRKVAVAQARLLGAIHQVRSDGRGALTAQQRGGGFCLSYWFEEELDVFADANAVLMDADTTARALAVARFLRGFDGAFADISGFSLVHGDAGVTNTLFDDGQVGLIDFEWACVDDPVRDLCYLAGRIGCAPWYGFGDEATREAVLRVHAEVSGTVEELVSQRLRLDGWEVAERSLMWLDVLTCVGMPSDGDGRYTRAAPVLAGGIDTALGR